MRQLNRSLGIPKLLARRLQLADIAHVLHAPGQLGPNTCGLLHLLGIGRCLLRRDRLHPGLAYGTDLFDHIHAQLQLHLLHRASGQALALRQGQEIEQTKTDAPSDFGFIEQAGPLQPQPRVGDTALLRGLRCIGHGPRQQGL